MSLTSNADGREVHYPANPDRFEFDQEVSRIFLDMAHKSIPLFYQTHELHAHLCRPWITADQEHVDIADFGASRGTFLESLLALHNLSDPRIRIRAVDYSESMAAYLRRDFPYAQVDVLDMGSEAFQRDHRTYDIINCTYVLQFIRPELQVRVLRKLTQMLKPGGVLFLGQKLECDGPAGRMLHDQYIRFRVEHGYTLEEIEAKTRALKNAMWPMSGENLIYYLNNFGLEVHQTSHWTVFSNYMCIKGL